jgi:metal-responsive CopG/Arc/MetJ family transcriptional regulator
MPPKKNVRQKPRRVGRPVTVSGECSVTIRIPEALLTTIDELADIDNASRSEVMRQLLERGLKAVERRAKRKDTSR